MGTINLLKNCMESKLRNSYQYATKNNKILSRQEQACTGGLAYNVASELRLKKPGDKLTIDNLLGHFNNHFASITNKIDVNKDGNLTEEEIKLIDKNENGVPGDVSLSWYWSLKRVHKNLEKCDYPLKPGKMDLAWYPEFVGVLQKTYAKIAELESIEKDPLVKNEFKKRCQEIREICSGEFDILSKPAGSHIYAEPDKLKEWVEKWKKFHENFRNDWQYNKITQDLIQKLYYNFADYNSALKIFFKPEDLSYEWFRGLNPKEKEYACDLHYYLPDFSEDELYGKDPHIKKVAKNILGEERFKDYYDRCYNMSDTNSDSMDGKYKIHKPRVNITNYTYKGEPWAYKVDFSSSCEDSSGWELDSLLSVMVDREGNFISEWECVGD